MSFQLSNNSNLTIENLNSITDPLVWSTVASQWTTITEFPDKFASYEDTFNDWLEGAALLNSDTRSDMMRWAAHLVKSGGQTPDHMPIDKALISNKPFAFVQKLTEGKVTSSLCEITTSEGSQIVRASRVPIPDSALPTEKGVCSAYPGSDIVAASLGAMTKWNEGLSVTIPLVSLKKFGYQVIDPELSSTLAALPIVGPKKVGLGGRAWAHYLMAKFNQMSKSAYFEIAHSWCRAVFKLPLMLSFATPDDCARWISLQLPWIVENFSVKPIKCRVRVRNAQKNGQELFEDRIQYYWYPTYKKTALLRGLKHAYDSTVTTYGQLYACVQDFSAVQQGVRTGIGMLAQARDSWGLPSQELVWCEQAVSAILGSANKRTLLMGWSQLSIRIIRASVEGWDPSRVVYEHCDPAHADSALKKSASVIDFLLVYSGPTNIGTGVKGDKRSNITQYSPTAVLDRHWSPVERVFSHHPNKDILYIGCVLPPLVGPDLEGFKTELKVYCPKTPWDGFAIVTRSELKCAHVDEKGELALTALVPKTHKEFAQQMVACMNEVATVWAVPYCRISCAKTALLKPHSVSARERCIRVYNADTGDFETQWADIGSDDVVAPPVVPAGISSPLPISVPSLEVDDDFTPTALEGGDEIL